MFQNEHSRSEQELEENHKSEPSLERIDYKSELGKIELAARKFEPENAGYKTDQAIFLIAGYGIDASFTQLDQLGQSFANHGEMPSYAVSTKVEKPGMPNALMNQAKAISNYIIEKGLTEITLAGYSEGGDKSIDLAVLLQKLHPEVKINGLILMDAMGLYEQDKAKVLGNFMHDAAATSWDAIKHAVTKFDFSYAAGANTSGLELVGAAWDSRHNITERMNADIAAMSKQNENMKELNMPIVLVQGKHDLVSEDEKIIPDEEAMEKNREKYLKENLFTSSPYVRMLVADKLGQHALPIVRGESVAKTSLYMLERYRRNSENQKAA